MATGNKNKAEEVSLGSRFISGLKDLILEDETPDSEKAEAIDPAPDNQTRAAPRPPYAHAPNEFATNQFANTQPMQTASSLMQAASSSMQTASSPMTANLLELVLGKATAYTALHEAIKPLEEIIPDEMTRYRAAFAVIKKNRSLDQVVQAIDMQHMQLLNDEAARFAAQAKQKEAKDIDVRVAEAKTLKDNVEAAALQIIKLREETEHRISVVEAAVQRDRTRLDEIDRELLEKRQSIAQVQAQFNNAIASVKDTLVQNKAKILRYLTP